MTIYFFFIILKSFWLFVGTVYSFGLPNFYFYDFIFLLWASVNSILSDFFIYPNLFKEEIFFSFHTRDFGISPWLTFTGLDFDFWFFTARLTFTGLDFDFWFFSRLGLPSRACLLGITLPGLHWSAWITQSGLRFSLSTAVYTFYLCVILHGVYCDLFSAQAEFFCLIHPDWFQEFVHGESFGRVRDCRSFTLSASVWFSLTALLNWLKKLRSIYSLSLKVCIWFN